MRREWSPDELVESWTLVGQDWLLVGNKSGATRLGFALLLKFIEREARFPQDADELPASVVAYVAEQVQVAALAFGAYPWSGRSIKYYRGRSGPRSASASAPAGTRTSWPGGWQLREALLVRCRTERIEPPGRADRIIASARRRSSSDSASARPRG